MYATEFRKTGLEDILFVDVMDEMVNNIQLRFTADWEEEISLGQYREDIFTFDEGKPMSQTSKSGGVFNSREVKQRHSKVQALETKSDLPKKHDSSKQNKMFLSSNQADLLTGKPEAFYDVGNFKLRVSAESAFDQRSDLIVVVGDLFLELHGKPGFDINKVMRANTKYPQKNKVFAVLGGERALPLIIQLFIDRHDQENFDRAFKRLGDFTEDFTHHFTLMQSVVFTSTSLYSGKFGISLQLE